MQNNQINFNSLYNQFVQNPAQFLIKNRFNIPENIGSNPQTIIQHLLSSGQITQQQLMQVQSMIPQMQKLFNNHG
jgi:hypothetical protein